MDIRIEKTENAIKNAFLEIRARKPLEKITVKELCACAQINKSTFYAHYQDIYALSEKLEQEIGIIWRILENIRELAGMARTTMADWSGGILIKV